VPDGLELEKRRDLVERLAVGRADDDALHVLRRRDLETAAAENVKRVVVGKPDSQSLYEISAFLELKTVWHPIGT
jgi:hypothetical protein